MSKIWRSSKRPPTVENELLEKGGEIFVRAKKPKGGEHTADDFQRTLWRLEMNPLF